MWTKNNMPDLSGKTAMVTGANTGLGFETALALYEAGAHVILACRNQASAEEAMDLLWQKGGKGTLELGILNLASLKAIEEFASGIKQRHRKLHILINNAGVMIPPASKTAEGFELQFGVNFLGHFALTGHLYPLLKKTEGAKVVTVSSLAYLRGEINFDNLRSEIDYDPMREYQQSKLGNILFSLELQRRIEQAGDKVISIATQPGANKTDLIRHMSNEEYEEALKRFGVLMEAWQGALPALYAASEPAALGGRLYGPDQDGGVRGYPAEAEIIPKALDEELAKKLWNWATEASGIDFPI